ncbi:hypothetical protein J6590_010876 [Homalodisca vitripennis]|nr:hypothetical protein J6590_010876 [Homalodisca vitripennis]
MNEPSGGRKVNHNLDQNHDHDHGPCDQVLVRQTCDPERVSCRSTARGTPLYHPPQSSPALTTLVMDSVYTPYYRSATATAVVPHLYRINIQTSQVKEEILFGRLALLQDYDVTSCGGGGAVQCVRSPTLQIRTCMCTCTGNLLTQCEPSAYNA